MSPFPASSVICEAWVQAIVRASIQGGLALAVAWLVCRVFQQKLPAAVRCWVLRLAFAKAILALIWWAPINLPLLRSAPPQTTAFSPIVPAASEGPAVPAPIQFRAPQATSIDSRLVWIGIWMAGVSVTSISLGGSWLKTRRFRATCVPLTDPATRKHFERLSIQLRIRRVPALLWSPDAGSPLLVGLLRPAVVVPQGILQRCGSSQLALMLAHELAHQRRHDLWWAWLPATGRVLLWFHPLVWLTGREWAVAQESACDQMAMAATGAASSEYGNVLLTAAAHLSYRNNLLAVGTCTSRSHLKRRIVAMGHVHNWNARRWICAGLVLAFIGIVALLPWKLVAKDLPVPRIAAMQADANDRVPILSDIPLLKDVFTKHRSGHPASGPAPSEDASSGRQHTSMESAVGLITTETFVLRAPHDGTIHRIDAGEGADVKANQVLVELASEAEAADVRMQNAQVGKDQELLHEGQKLFDQHAISHAELDQRHTTLVMDLAKLDAAKTRFLQNQLMTPIAGVVSESHAHTGEFVKQGEKLSTVVSVLRPHVQFALPASLYPDLQVGDAVEFRTAIYPGTFTGKIIFISPAIDPQSGTFQAKAVLDDPDLKLRAGMTGTATVHVK